MNINKKRAERIFWKKVRIRSNVMKQYHSVGSIMNIKSIVRTFSNSVASQFLAVPRDRQKQFKTRG